MYDSEKPAGHEGHRIKEMDPEEGDIVKRMLCCIDCGIVWAQVSLPAEYITFDLHVGEERRD